MSSPRTAPTGWSTTDTIPNGAYEPVLNIRKITWEVDGWPSVCSQPVPEPGALLCGLAALSTLGLRVYRSEGRV